jgi:uncharacterized protein (TIGR00156 family)
MKSPSAILPSVFFAMSAALAAALALLPLSLGLHAQAAADAAPAAQAQPASPSAPARTGASGADPGAPAGGADGPTMEPITVAEAVKSNDDTDVLLHGSIVRGAGDGKYIFKDQTGEVTVEIDDWIWPEGGVSPEDEVWILGEVDKEMNGDIEIDVMLASLSSPLVQFTYFYR